MIGRRAVQRPVDGEAPQVQVEVVLEGEADAAVHLHAVLHELGAVLADVRLGRTEQLSGVGRARLAAAQARVADGVARLEPGHHVGEPVLQRLVRRQRSAEGVPVERPLDRHVEPGLHRPDRLGVERCTSASWNWRSTSARGRPAVPDHGGGRERTSSNVTWTKRRVRSTVCIGRTETPDVSVGTSTWVSSDSVATR